MDNSRVSSTWVITCISPCLINIVGLLITSIGIELEEPSQWCFNYHDSKIKIYSFVGGKNWLLAKTINHRAFHQPNMHVVIALFCSCSTVLLCQHIPCADPFRAATYYVVDFSDEEWGSLGRCRAAQLCRWSSWTHFIFQAFRCYRIVISSLLRNSM